MPGPLSVEARRHKFGKPIKSEGKYYYQSYKHPRLSDDPINSHGPFETKDAAATHRSENMTRSSSGKRLKLK